MGLTSKAKDSWKLTSPARKPPLLPSLPQAPVAYKGAWQEGEGAEILFEGTRASGLLGGMAWGEKVCMGLLACRMAYAVLFNVGPLSVSCGTQCQYVVVQACLAGRVRGSTCARVRILGVKHRPWHLVLVCCSAVLPGWRG